MSLRSLHLALVLSGACTAFASSVAAAAPAQPATVDGFTHFITRDGDRLLEGDGEYRWVSVNAPDVLQLISNYRFDGEHPATRYRLPDDYELRDAVRTVRQMGGRVMRTFVITCRQGAAPEVAFDLSTSPATPNEAALRVLDRLLQLCHEEGVRLIIPLVAYNSAVRGDWKTYGEDFWNVGSPANQKFKDVVRQVLTRTNSLNGRPYLEDKAILGWHTGNELVIGDDPARRAWLHDFAAYVKSLDRHHLLIDGRNRPADVFGKYDEFAADPNIDAVSYHTYVNLPQADTPAGTLRLLREQTRGKIPLIVTEVAMYTKPDALRALLDEIIEGGAVGANWWAVRFHNRDGGFYKHSDRESQFEDLNWPGFADPIDLPEISRERELLDIHVEYAARINGTAPITPVTPEAPTFLPATDVGHLNWQGSTGASGYDVERASSADGPWTIVAANQPDNLVVYAPQFCDATAEIGATYFYRVLARNGAGVSAPSNVVGPLKPDRRWLVDELFDRSHLDAASSNLHLDRAYAHSAYLEDIALVRRADPAQSASLVYTLPGAVRSFSLNVFAAEVAPRFMVRDAQGAATEVTPRVTAYNDGKRARYTAELPAGSAARTLEIVLSSNAAPQQAIGRIEISWGPQP